MTFEQTDDAPGRGQRPRNGKPDDTSADDGGIHGEHSARYIIRKLMKVPLLDLQAQYAPIRDEALAAIARVCDSQRFIGGPEIDSLERELASMLGVKHAIGVSSGTDALLVALMAAGVGVGDEVVTTAYSFFATAGCVARLGATPVFVDIDPVTFNIDPAQVEGAITPATKAIVPVHLFGLVADMDLILDVARRRKIVVIEDAAQAIGARHGDRQAGSFGELSCFSFFPSKNLRNPARRSSPRTPGTRPSAWCWSGRCAPTCPSSTCSAPIPSGTLSSKASRHTSRR